MSAIPVSTPIQHKHNVSHAPPSPTATAAPKSSQLPLSFRESTAPTVTLHSMHLLVELVSLVITLPTTVPLVSKTELVVSTVQHAMLITGSTQPQRSVKVVSHLV